MVKKFKKWCIEKFIDVFEALVMLKQIPCIDKIKNNLAEAMICFNESNEKLDTLTVKCEKEIQQMQVEIKELQEKNQKLREENQKLRKEIMDLIQSLTPVVEAKDPASEITPGQVIDEWFNGAKVKKGAIDDE